MKYKFLIISLDGYTDEVDATSYAEAISNSNYLEKHIAQIIRLFPV